MSDQEKKGESAGLWVMSAPGIPCGAKRLGVPSGSATGRGKTWIDVCIIGSHIPQMYGNPEIHPLEKSDCDRLGICPECLGFGDVGDFEVVRTSPDITAVARDISQIASPCAHCAGSGRPAIRARVVRAADGSVRGSMAVVPHAYVPPLPMEDLVQGELFYTRNPELFGASHDMCLACGHPRIVPLGLGEPVHTS